MLVCTFVCTCVLCMYMSVVCLCFNENRNKKGEKIDKDRKRETLAKELSSHHPHVTSWELKKKKLVLQ